MEICDKKPVWLIAAARSACKKTGGELSALRADDALAKVARQICAGRLALENIENAFFCVGSFASDFEQGVAFAASAARLSGFFASSPAFSVVGSSAAGASAAAVSVSFISEGAFEAGLCAGADFPSRSLPYGFNPSFNPEIYAAEPSFYGTIGAAAELIAGRENISREEMDEWAALSRARVEASVMRGDSLSQIVPLEIVRDELGVPLEKKIWIETDDLAARADIAKAKGVYKKDGRVTVANSAHYCDNVSAFVLAGSEFCEKCGVSPVCKLSAPVISAGNSGDPLEAVVKAINSALSREGLALADVDAFEIDEQCAAAPLGLIKRLRLDPRLVNQDGGSLAYGNCFGASFARIITGCAAKMQREKISRILVAQCAENGAGAAVLLTNAT